MSSSPPRPGKVALKRGLGLSLMGLATITLSASLVLRSVGNADSVLVPRESVLVWKGEATGTPGQPTRADVRFMLDNVGRGAVRVLSTESGCGCARPIVRPAVVAPGGVATVDVSALPVPVGQKDVQITVHTDSATSPDVLLTLPIMGTREPPFLFQFWGDLNFRGGYSSDLSREITVATVEPRNQPAVADLEVSTDVPFFKIEPAGIVEQPYTDTEAVLRKRRYKVGFTEKPSGTFTGSVIVKDPWEPRSSMTIGVAGQFQSGLTVAPARVVLNGPENTKASLLVIADEPIAALDLDIEGPPGLPLTVEDSGLGKKAVRAHRLTVVLGGPASDWVGLASIKIRQPGSRDELTVPVTISTE